jgi:uncharacterized protein (TIGR02145 family)
MKAKSTTNRFWILCGNRFYRISSIACFVSLLFIVTLTNSCRKSNETPPPPETGTLTDNEGNTYKTVKIGNQWWMAEDLKTRIYSDGTYINQIESDSAQWSTDTIGAFCNNKDDLGNVIGKLYNNYAVNNTSKLAPAGWHIPNDEEWKVLEMYLGMSQAEADKLEWRGTDEGEKIKIQAPLGWAAYGNVWATNESGFTALATGCRLFNGVTGYPGYFSTGFWWSTTTYEGNTTAWYRYLDYKNENVFRSHCSKNYGFSVRCVKD